MPQLLLILSYIINDITIWALCPWEWEELLVKRKWDLRSVTKIFVTSRKSFMRKSIYKTIFIAIKHSAPANWTNQGQSHEWKPLNFPWGIFKKSPRKVSFCLQGASAIFVSSVKKTGLWPETKATVYKTTLVHPLYTNTWASSGITGLALLWYKRG